MEAVKEEVDREVPLPADGPPAGAQPSGIDGLPTTAFQPLANGGSS